VRIVHIITRFIRGGADENTMLSCNAQAEAGHEVHLVYGHEHHPDILSKVDRRVTLHNEASLRREIAPLDDVLVTLRLWHVFRQLKPDIVHTHTSKAGFVGRFAAVFARVPIIVHGVHILPFLNVGPGKRLLYWLAEKMLAPYTDAFVDVSEGMKDECLRAGIGTQANHLVVASGMDIDKFQSALPIQPATFKALFPDVDVDLDQAEIVLMVAAFEERKRQMTFLGEFVEVARLRPQALLLLAGDGPCRQSILDRISELGLAGRVLLLGFRDDIERWMKLAQVCVLASEREGLPRVIVQYALAGRPIVATYLPGIEAVVRDKISGYLVTHVQDMRAPVLQLLSDKALAASMAEASRESDLSAWGVDNMSSQLDMLYEGLAAKKRKRCSGPT